MNVYLAKFMMYFEIHRMHRAGHSISQISKHLVVNRRTVTRYLSMTEQDYEAFLVSQSERNGILHPYEQFVVKRLQLFGDTSAAQMHDWLKEHFTDFPLVSPKTVFNFVCRIRGKFNIPRIQAHRQHHPVEELPFGKQAQVDFGEYNLRTSLGKRIKVFFFVFLLSRSRYKYLWFSDRYFTSELAIQCHEQAFEYIGGIPQEIVYDQDKVFLVSENSGDIILTDGFRAYTRERTFSLHFCRKSDPQSKGKVENAVGYIKQNFLYNRTYHNMETLNDEALGWLGRTANALPHGFTRKEPVAQWAMERSFLQPYAPCRPIQPPVATYAVRKDNTVSFKGNFYSLPLGTYKGRGTLVGIRVDQNELVITPLIADSPGRGEELCRHPVAQDKGLKIINTDHKRDKSAAIDEMIQQLGALLPDPQLAKNWLAIIRTAKPRYIRDQLLMIRKTIQGVEPALVSQTMHYCLLHQITSATDFKEILSQYREQEPDQTIKPVLRLNPLNGKMPEAALSQPGKSDIADYQAILKEL